MGRTALHIAADRGNRMITLVIIASCLDCCELVDNRGRNALHNAILAGHRGSSIVRIILRKSSLSNLLNEKDVDRNTPLHHQLMSFSPLCIALAVT
ncbi:hypothetical protein CJ030_MR6G010362 [Morella rubra]|uniref:Uncharacterized protein n=1 Tax=Morella rubra TaxID=262757 RepID=A0A6A1WXF1_9ROSI|nr:hypothetical protein CJ030_MR6G010362 [Morella rubra]